MTDGCTLRIAMTADACVYELGDVVSDDVMAEYDALESATEAPALDTPSPSTNVAPKTKKVKKDKKVQKRTSAVSDDVQVAVTAGDWLGRFKQKRMCMRADRPATATGQTDASTSDDAIADVMDELGVWNVAQVVATPSDDSVHLRTLDRTSSCNVNSHVVDLRRSHCHACVQVEVRFQGYDKREDEIVSLDSDRVAPFHTNTWTAKCWAKYLNWPHWPALVRSNALGVRRSTPLAAEVHDMVLTSAPTAADGTHKVTVLVPGTLRGARTLRKMTKLFVDFVDHASFDKRTRCWVDKRDLEPFKRSFERCRQRSTGQDFELALERVLLSPAADTLPTYRAKHGVLPKQYATTLAAPLAQLKRSMGDDLWLKNFATTTERFERMLSTRTLNDYRSMQSQHPDYIPIMRDLCDDSEDTSHRRVRKAKKRAQPKTRVAKALPTQLPTQLPAQPPSQRKTPSVRVHEREVATKEREDPRHDRQAVVAQADTACERQAQASRPACIGGPEREVAAKEREDSRARLSAPATCAADHQATQTHDSSSSDAVAVQSPHSTRHSARADGTTTHCCFESRSSLRALLLLLQPHLCCSSSSHVRARRSSRASARA